MRSLQVTARDAGPIADSARFLDERGGGRPLGMAAVSFAVGPAIIALDEPAAAGRVDFFIAIGGYYDLEALITYVTTGFYREQEAGPWSYRPPNVYGKWVCVLTNSARIADPDDRATLFEMARRKLDDADADVTDSAIALGPKAIRVRPDEQRRSGSGTGTDRRSTARGSRRDRAAGFSGVAISPRSIPTFC